MEIGIRNWLTAPVFWLFLKIISKIKKQKIIGFELSPKCKWLKEEGD